MKKITDLAKVFQRDISDVLAVDLGASGTKVVRLKKVGAEASVVAVDLLPKLVFPAGDPGAGAPLQLDRALQARYVALAGAGATSIVKLISFPSHSEKSPDAHVNELMGLGNDADFRMGYEILSETRAERRVLAAAIPERDAQAMLALFPTGTPAPCSLEVSGLAGLTAFERGAGLAQQEGCVAAIECGAQATLVAFYNKGVMVMVRKFEFGANSILKKLQGSLGVDEEVAAGILNDGSFDISQILHHAMEPFLQQLVISWDFVERREDVRVGALYACGGGMMMRSWGQEMETATGQKPQVWNPFEGLTLADGAFPQRLKGQESRFAAAVGAGLSMLGAS
jgi:Tfp pilus assembly PilM family ATPase